MAGHSHSSNIKFRKDRVDQKRAKAFAKLSRMITVAARQGGSIDGNPRLRLAVEKARVLSMAKDVIDRAIKKGTGEAGVGDYEEFTYEGYGPGGVAMMLEILTDNRNRTAPDVRRLFDDAGGNLAANGAVSWMFERRGVFAVAPAPTLAEDALLEQALAAGAEDVVADAGAFTIYCALGDFAVVKAELERRSVPVRLAELAYVPKQRVAIADAALARRVTRLLDQFEDNDDVQAVYNNEEFTDEVVRQLTEDA